MDGPGPFQPLLEYADLIEPVRRVLGSTTVEGTDWQVQTLTGGFGLASGACSASPAACGARARASPGHRSSRSWARPPGVARSVRYFSDASGDGPSGLNYWKREVLAYQTGLLDELPACLVAPRCFGGVEHAGSGPWLWREDVLERTESRWSLTDVGRAAQHLGCFNGADLAGKRLTNGPCMSGASRRRLTRLRPRCAS